MSAPSESPNEPKLKVIGAYQTIDKPEEPETGDVDVNNLLPICGACCFLISCVPDCYTCIGAVSQTTCCCLTGKSVLCKPATKNNYSSCELCLFQCDLGHMQTLCFSRSQCLCLDCRTAVPTNEEMPCILTIFAWTLCVNSSIRCRCCEDYDDIIIG